MDYFAHGRVMPDTSSDVLNTVFWPTVLFIGLRLRRAHKIYAAPDHRPLTPSAPLAQLGKSNRLERIL